MLRSPSHESVITDISLFSVSSLASEVTGRSTKLVTFKSYTDMAGRGQSPNPDSKHARPPDIPEIVWFEEENDLIRSCAALSSALGLQKSFSTGDICQLLLHNDTPGVAERSAVSELALSSLQRTGCPLDHPRLEHASRSCSTWVAVGDIASTSQLPSPHGGQTATNTPIPSTPFFTAADFIRSVNKKVRQNYIRRRVLTTYKALERLSQSEFNLDRLELVATAATSMSMAGAANGSRLTVPGPRTITPMVLTVSDVERERGKPLNKYDRNIMIFNWLHTLDELVEGP